VSNALDPDLISALRDIVFWGERVGSHLVGVNEELFLSSDLHADAVCFCISSVGEAAARIRREWPSFAAAHPELELARSSAMRNRLIHGYFAVDNRIVWGAATISVPRLVDAARQHLG
jgi:uncharacterized protein with HEPN domain